MSDIKYEHDELGRTTLERTIPLKLEERVAFYEKIYDELTTAKLNNEKLSDELMVKLSDLKEYYTSSQWLADYEADESGIIPRELKRGVLSQDGVYDLLDYWQEAAGELREYIEEAVLNEELVINIPEGFHELGVAELESINHYGNVPDWCISDPDRHMILSISWKKNGLAAMLLSSKDVAKKMETELKRLMAAYNFETQGEVKEDVGGLKADGFRYSYKAQSIDMAGETLSIKKGKMFYYIHCYMREELLHESRQVLKEILKSARWM